MWNIVQRISTCGLCGRPWSPLLQDKLYHNLWARHQARQSNPIAQGAHEAEKYSSDKQIHQLHMRMNSFMGFEFMTRFPRVDAGNKLHIAWREREEEKSVRSSGLLQFRGGYGPYRWWRTDNVRGSSHDNVVSPKA